MWGIVNINVQLAGQKSRRRGLGLGGRQRRMRQRSAGFTIVELMVVLGIFGVLLVVGVPGFQNTLKNNRMASEMSSLRSSLGNARSEAMARRMPVRLCESANGTACSTSDAWTSGYIAYADEDDDNVLDAGEDVFMVQRIDLPDDVSLVFRNASNAVTRSTRFSSRGDSLGDFGHFVICDDRGETQARGLALTAAGSARSLIDEDDPEDGIINIPGGDDVSCP